MNDFLFEAHYNHYMSSKNARNKILDLESKPILTPHEHFLLSIEQAAISRCWHIGCESTYIIDCHAISERQYLRRICGKSNMLIHVGHNHKPGSQWHHNGKLDWQLKRVPAASASVFRGFCSKHDNQLFQEIDKGISNEITERQKLLFAYRAFTYYRHLREEAIRMAENSIFLSSPIRIQTAEKLEQGTHIRKYDSLVTYDTYAKWFDDALHRGDTTKFTTEARLLPDSWLCYAAVGVYNAQLMFSEKFSIEKDRQPLIISTALPTSAGALFMFTYANADRDVISGVFDALRTADPTVKSVNLSLTAAQDVFIGYEHVRGLNKNERRRLLTYFNRSAYEMNSRGDSLIRNSLLDAWPAQLLISR